MADAGVGEALLLSEFLGESYAVPGIFESTAAATPFLGESYAVPGIVSGASSSLMGAASPWAATSPYAMFTADAAGLGYPGMADLIGESYAVPGMIPGAAESPYGMFTADALKGGLPGAGAGGNWYDMFFKPGGPNTGGIVDFLKSMNMTGQLAAGTVGSQLLKKMMAPPKPPGAQPYEGPLSKFRYDPSTFNPYTPAPPMPPYRAQYAGGGIAELAAGGLNNPTGPVERMSQGVVGAGGMYPQSQMDKTYFATPTQMPASAEVIGADYDVRTNPYTGVMMAAGGIADLGSYSDGGRLLKGPGDGMSDSIPAKIGSRQPARLADGEFVVPADVVSHLGNGSTDAGAKQLYTMMDRVRKTRTGTKKQGREINPARYMPA